MLFPVSSSQSKSSGKQTGSIQSFRPTRNAAADLILSLTFAESLDLEKYAQGATAAALSHARKILPAPGDAVSLSLNSLRTFCEQNTMLVGLSPNLSKRLREGNVKWAAKKTGERYGELTDTAGKFAGKATEVERGVKVARTAAMAAAIVVEASHLIASADMARMQRETIEKLDRLEAYHIIEHEAELERLYFRAREILEYPLDHERQQELRQIRSQLLKLRIVWRKEAIHNLSQLKDPRNVGWLNTIFSGQEARDQHVIKAVLDEVGRFTLIDYTLRLDYTLGLASETWTESKYTIEAELVELTKLSTLLGEKCNYVSDARRDRVKHINGAMAYIPPYYEEMLQISNQNLDAILPAIDQSLVQVR